MKPKGVVGSYTRLLDAFGYLRFDLGSMPSELRLGRQVVDWGESTFIPGGLNSVNYFDVTALQVPGAELKQALLPDTMALFNSQLTKDLSTQLLVPVHLASGHHRAARCLLQHQRRRGRRRRQGDPGLRRDLRTRAWTSAPSAAG